MTKILYIPESGFIWFRSTKSLIKSTVIFEESVFYFMPFEKDEDLLNLIMQYAKKYPGGFNDSVLKEELEIIKD